MSTLLLTGASGFLGRYVLERARARFDRVVCVSRRPPPLLRGTSFVPCDLLDRDARERAVRSARATHCLHLAWYARHGAFWSASQNLAWVGATLHLVERFAACGGQRFVGVGSCAEYTWGGDASLSEHDSPRQPATLYGAAKNATWQAIEAFAPTVGLDAAWGRVFFPFGPGEDERRLVASVVRALASNRPAPCSDGRQVRDFLHAQDAARALVELAVSPLSGALNIASGEGTSVRSLVEMLAHLAGRPDLPRFGALPTRAGEPARIVADSQRLRDELSLTAEASLRDRLASTWHAWHNGNGP